MREPAVKRWVVHCCLLFGDVGILSFLFFLFTACFQKQVGLRYGLWLAALVLVYSLNTFFQRRRVTLRLTVLVDIALSILTGLSAAHVVTGDPAEIDMGYFLAFLLLGGSAVHAAVLPTEQLEEANCALYADGLLVSILLSLLIAWWLKIPGVPALVKWDLAALAAVLFAMLAKRSQSLHRGLLLLPALSVSLLFLAFSASSHLKGAADVLLRAVFRLRDLLIWLAIQLATLLYRLILWIVELLPQPETAQMAPREEPEKILQMQEEAVELPFAVYVICMILLAAFLITVVYFIMRALKGLRWQGPPGGEETRGAVRKSRIGRAFADLLRRIQARIRFELSYLRNRDTAAGLLVYTERAAGGRAGVSGAGKGLGSGKAGPGAEKAELGAGKAEPGAGKTRFSGEKTGLGRARGESGPAYLRRISRALAEVEAGVGTGTAQMAELLADQLERAIYGGGQERVRVSGEFCRRYRKEIRKLIRGR